MTIEELEQLQKAPLMKVVATDERVNEYLTPISKTKVVLTLDYLDYNNISARQFVKRMKYGKFRGMRSVGNRTAMRLKKLLTEFFQVEWPDDRGGAREGAGRKRKNGFHHHIYLSEDVHRYLSTMPNQSRFVENCIRLKYRIDHR